MDPIVSTALKVVSALKARYDAEHLRKQLEQIEQTLGALSQRIEQVLDIDVKAAFDHLETASLTTNSNLRQAELAAARQSFNRMTKRPTQPLPGSGRSQLSAEQIAAVGHAGNFSYFLLQNEPRLALLEAYRCTERFPALGVQLFPVEIFSRDYRAAGQAVAQRQFNRELYQELHRNAVAFGKQDRAEYLREAAWRVPLAGAVFLGSLLAGTVAPPLAGQAVMRAAGILNGMGNRGLTDLPQIGRQELDPRAHARDPEAEAALMEQARAESERGRRALEGSG